MKKFLKIIIFGFISLFFGCSSEDQMVNNTEIPNQNLNYLALGDSYTIGQSVCQTCSFPIQLQDSLKKQLPPNKIINTTIIATTGWTTTNLKSALATQNVASNYDFVTLCIGVNNQNQNLPFTIYQQEFQELVATAISKAKGVKQNLIVISIPDYAFTPYGNGNTTISNEIDNYNLFAKNYCEQNGINYLNITDISKLGIEQPSLVASDGLHLSALAYSQFVNRLLPKSKQIVGL